EGGLEPRARPRSLAAHPPRVNELFARQVLELLVRGRSTENGVAMRVPAEACDHVAMPARLAGGELERLAKLGRRFSGQPCRQSNAKLVTFQNFRMSERKQKKRLLPRRRERFVVAGRDAGAGEPLRFRILRKRFRRAAKDRSRKLVEDDHQRKARA